MNIINGKITNATILVVDDEKDIREALVAGLDLVGIELKILTAENAASALAISNEHIPDVIILDFNMPLKDGFEFAKEVRSLPALHETKLIMLTAQNTPANNWKSVESKIDVFVGKPFDLTELEAHIYSLLVTTQQGGRRKDMGFIDEFKSLG